MKKLDLYIYRQFFPVLVMTFFICMLIFEMQFLWKHVADLVGKGLSVGILAEFLVYSSATVVQMSLPLAILLASLMTFGNLGENFELTAMKSAGISLFRIMLPVIVFISMVCVGAFFFSNNILPKAQTKLWTLVFSLRQKSPELEIPAGEFYDGIQGYNIYVESKENGWLKNIMIYDFSKGFDNATVTVADSGKIAFTGDKKYLLLTLLRGESFENAKQQRMSYAPNSTLYWRQNFKNKDILLDFNSDFKRFDESVMHGQYVSKNATELLHTIDSINILINQQMPLLANNMITYNYLGRERLQGFQPDDSKGDSKMKFDSIFTRMNMPDKQRVVSETMNIARQKKESNSVNAATFGDTISKLRQHQIELYRKFTLSFACLIFFFIGAPLGAIIRKGGLGMPIVTSVLMFIFYYIIDNTGFKMAREGLWEAWRGMLLSSAVLLPIGIFLTSKAAADATLFRTESYLLMWEKIKTFFRKR
ncbi:MAG: LptF/LptG family permease [Prevotellaceae bacterium]|jgi:lipopolysaccharide export system permease protein|nr:LptF/LptG family permease [Prevotellaceae bacterium]